MTRRRTRYAVVGLGYIAQASVLPAFDNARKNSELVALVSGDRDKLRQLCDIYGVNGYTYEQYDDLMASGDVDAVYVALPNDQHHDYTIRAARAGVDVLCEKPMAVTARECEEMIRVCAQNDVKLMVAYRLFFDEGHRKAMDLVHGGRLGAVRLYHSLLTMQVKQGDIRLSTARGGGTLYDIGVYCINTARHVFAAEPEEVFAWTGAADEPRFGEVEEMCSAVMRFPGDRIANFSCSFGAARQSTWVAVGTEGVLHVEPAFDIDEELRHVMIVGGRKKERVFAPHDQFAAELTHFSRCVQEGAEPDSSGREGLADVRIIQALYQSAAEGHPIRLVPQDVRPPTPGATEPPAMEPPREPPER